MIDRAIGVNPRDRRAPTLGRPGFLELDEDAVTDLLRAFNHQPLPRLQALCDDPFALVGAIDLHTAGMDLWLTFATTTWGGAGAGGGPEPRSHPPASKARPPAAAASGNFIEAMKMEHTIHAPMPGSVTAVFFGEGDLVEEGVELLTIDAAGGH